MFNRNLFFSSQSFYWNTPNSVFNELNNEFHFTLDPCSSDNHLLDKFYDENINGLIPSWEGESVFCNPPYNDIYKWVYKAFYEWSKYNINIVMLLPARTDTKWFHKFILNNCEIRFIEGRLKFNGSKNNAPFPSMICIFHKGENL